MEQDLVIVFEELRETGAYNDSARQAYLTLRQKHNRAETLALILKSLWLRYQKRGLGVNPEGRELEPLIADVMKCLRPHPGSADEGGVRQGEVDFQMPARLRPIDTLNVLLWLYPKDDWRAIREEFFRECASVDGKQISICGEVYELANGWLVKKLQ